MRGAGGASRPAVLVAMRAVSPAFLSHTDGISVVSCRAGSGHCREARQRHTVSVLLHGSAVRCRAGSCCCGPRSGRPGFRAGEVLGLVVPNGERETLRK